MSREPSLSESAASARPYWKPAAFIVVAGTLLAALVAFVWPATYRGEVVLLPPT